MYGLASRMWHTGTISTGEALFRDYHEFYLRLGGLNTQTFTWSDFVEVIKVPIIVNNEINIDDMSKKLITDINFNKPIELSSELPGQTLELTPGYQDGGVAVKIIEVQHIE